jgi:Pro-kumamolisin, activation domain/Immunoglobulin I-set domain/Carbohydrate binding domain/Viral BACON domain
MPPECRFDAVNFDHEERCLLTTDGSSEGAEEIPEPLTVMKTKYLPVSAGISAVLLLATVFSGFGAGPRRFVRDNLPAAAARLHAIKDFPATNQLHLSIALPLRNQAELDALLKNIYDPASASYHRYLTPQQFAENFGPTKSDYQAVIKFAEKNGLKVTGTHPNRVVLDVTGSVADIENIFLVKIRVYNHPKEKRTFYAPDTEPSVDASLTVPILSISGLNNYSLPQPASLHLMPTNQPPGAKPNAGSGPSGTYLGRDFRLAYLPQNKLNGTGQSVALLEFDGYYSNDITAYENLALLPAATLTNVPVNGGIITPGSANDEVALDIEMVIAMATNVSKVLVYEAPAGTPWPTILSQIANDNLAAQISCSWGGGSPDPASEQIFQQMAAQGQSFFTSSGDNDAYVGSVPFPAESPNITVVGGTTLTTAKLGGARVSESVWNRGLDANSGDYVGTGGGISPNYSIPIWQEGINSFLTNRGSTMARNIPDVALTAENVYVKYGNGQSETVGGTSCAAPLWAGLMALVNQQAVAAGKPVVGFINPAIYEIANESISSISFNDITTGNNAWPASAAAFSAVTGYDLCTGLGTPKSTNLINALVSPDPLIVVSNGGFNATGSPDGTFDVASQTYYLTNVGTTSLDWSLVNTSAWLDVSNSGGTLVPGASDSVVVSLNTVASNLTAGTYPASLWFSNVTSHVGHSRFFVLQTSDALVISPPTKFFFNGPPGGPFAPATQGIILTNPSSGTLNWSINNTSVWFNVSPVSGSLVPGAQVSVTFTLTPAAVNLTDGFYTAVFQVTNLASQFVQLVTGVVSVGIVQNGGFETGDFSGWTLVGNTNDSTTFYNGVVGVGTLADGSGPSFIHSGSYGAFLGDTNLAILSQIIPTTPGQNYVLSFWIDNPMSGAGQQFLVNWNTNSATTNQIYLINNPGVLAWKEITFAVTATDTNTSLQFSAQNPPDAFGLDDISVIAILPPAFTAQPTNLTVLAGNSAMFSASASGTAPLAYQWLKNGTNVANGGDISGATTTNLTITGVTTNDSANYTLVITNAYGSITSSVAALTVVLPPGINGVAINPDGSVTLILAGSPGVSYVLESTTNFNSGSGWLPVATNVFDTTGVWQFNDVSATTSPQRFYRLKYTQ